MHMIHFKGRAVNLTLTALAKQPQASHPQQQNSLTPLSHLLHICFLSKLRPTKACEAESTVATCSSC